jgi:hypothetical protein
LPNPSIATTNGGMASERLPIAGYPHLALAGQDDDTLHQKTLAGLRAEGFKIERGLLVPPHGAGSQTIIMAVTGAFTNAKRR